MTLAQSGLTREQDALARGWFGFGAWSAPFWFIGMEPGGDHGDWPNRWVEIGQPELVDCAWHCRSIGAPWHDGKIQRTWRGPIIATLAYQNVPYDREAVRARAPTYCVSDGDMVTIELSAIAARGLDVARPRTLYRRERVAHIRARFLEHAPTFAIFYGLKYRRDYEEIAGAFDANGFTLVDRTVCALAPHPRAKPSTRFWAELGLKLQHRVRSLESG